MALTAKSLQAALENNEENLITLIPSFMVLTRAVKLVENKEQLLKVILGNPEHIARLMPNPLCLQNMLKAFPDYKIGIIKAIFKNTALLHLMTNNNLTFNKVLGLLPEVKEALAYARQLYANQNKPAELQKLHKALTNNIDTLPQNTIRLYLLCVNELIKKNKPNPTSTPELTAIKNLLEKNTPRSLLHLCLRFIKDHNQENPQKRIEIPDNLNEQVTKSTTAIPTQTGTLC